MSFTFRTSLRCRLLTLGPNQPSPRRPSVGRQVTYSTPLVHRAPPLACFPSSSVYKSSSILIRRSVPSQALAQNKMSVRAGKSESGWASPTWNWGSARGDAHDEALKIRTKLNAPQSRSTWLEQMVTTDSLVSWSEVKLVLALKWQRAANARGDGGEAGYGYVMEQLRRAKYEGSVEADKKFVSDMEERLAVIVADADRSKLREFVEPMDGGQWMDAVKRESPTGYHRRSVAAQVLVALKFVDDGL